MLIKARIPGFGKSRAVANKDDIKNEVDCMLKIDHPNCIHFEELVESPKQSFIVLEYVAGGEFFDRIVAEELNGQGLGEAVTKFYALQMIEAIAYLHSRGITHRDIKPENILLLERQEYTVAKLTDFGLSKRLDSGRSMRTFCGTPTYIAPEMIENENEHYSPLIDVWSLGVVLFTAMVGYPPFSEGYNDGLTLNEQIKSGRLIYTSTWSEVSPTAKDFIASLLKVDPACRMSVGRAQSHEWFDLETRGHIAGVIEAYKATRKRGM